MKLALSISLGASRPLSAPFNPLKIASLGEWFDYRTLAGVGDGNPVSSWAGRKGLYSATGTGTTRPTYVADAGDGKGSVRYDGVDDFLSFSMTNGGLWGPDGQFEAWFKIKAGTSAASINELFLSGGTTQAINIQVQPSIPRLNWYSTGSSNFGAPINIQNGAWRIVRLVATTAAPRLFVDGVAIDFGTDVYGWPGSWNTGADTGYIGGREDFWKDDFRHFLTFKAPLDDATAAALTSYLMTA